MLFPTWQLSLVLAAQLVEALPYPLAPIEGLSETLLLRERDDVKGMAIDLNVLGTIKRSGEADEFGEDRAAKQWNGMGPARSMLLTMDPTDSPSVEEPQSTGGTGSFRLQSRDTCQRTTDCKIDLPANAHQRCYKGVCTFGCNRNHVKNKSGTGCDRLATPTSTIIFAGGNPTSSSRTTSSTTSKSATATAQKTYSGEATYYYQNDGYGACGNKNSDSTFIVAMDTRMYGDEDAVSKYCGRTVHIKNTDNDKTVVAKIQDACPTCASSGSLDLSVAAFKAIGELVTGILPIEWYFVD